MAIPVSGVPDQNYKPSLILFDSTSSVSFAWDGSHTLGAAYVQIVDNSGVPIVSFGGGTQYVTGDAQATPTGTVALGWDGTDVKALALDASGYLKVNVAAGSSGNAAASATGSAVPADADYIGFKDGSGNLTGVTIGQQLAAASIPVILPSATITTLTPPSNTGYALDSSLSTINTSLADVATLGAKTDAKSTATDATSVSMMQVLKQISASVQAPPSQAVTNAGTFAVQATLQASSGTDIGKLTANQSVNLAQVGGTNTVNGGLAGSLAIGGTVGNNVAPTGNPVPLAGIAVSSEPSANTATRISQLITDLVGKLIVLPYANPENFVSGAITSAMTGTTSTSLVAAPGAGLRNYITTIICSNSHATVGTDIIIQDGSGGTTLLTIPAAAVYGGAVINLPVPLRQPTANTALYCANVTTGASTKVSAVGYKGV